LAASAVDSGNGSRRSQLGTPTDTPPGRRTEGELLDRENNLVRLSRREWAVLKVLIGCGETTIPAQQLLDRSLNREGQQGTRSLYKYIGRLRTKLELDPQNPRRIILERGRGYRLEGPDCSWPVIIHPDGIFFGDGPPPTQNSPSASQQFHV
jgi:hypothetical protein